MNREQTENNIEQLLAEFSEQFTRTKNYKSIPQIELDLMMTTIRDLYEQLYALNKTNPLIDKKVSVAEIAEEKNVVAEVAAPVVEIISTPIIVEAERVEVVIPHVTEMSIVPEISMEATPIVETIKTIEEVKPKQAEKIIQVPVHQEEQIAVSMQRETVFQEKAKVQTKSVASLFDDVPTIGDHYTEQQSLHHKIGNTKTERLSDKFQQPVGDLKRSIGINEKFSFMNELFAGNQQQYNQSIEVLNNFPNFDEANAHLQELASTMKWNASSEIFDELKELVKRRFEA